MHTSIPGRDVWPYHALGGPERPGLVFLHGFLGRGAGWLDIAAGFSTDYYCVLPDLPGHGNNIRLPPGFRFDYATLVDRLHSLLERLELKSPVLVGYSLGGRVALSYCLQHPERVHGLVLESASPGLESIVDRQKRAALDAGRADRILSDGLREFLISWYRAPLFASLAARPGLLEKVVAQNNQNSPAWMAQAIRELSPGVQPSLWKGLPRLRLPVLLMAGELDRAYRETLASAAARLPRSELQVIPEAGHNIHLEQPAKFAAVLKDFLGRIGAP